MRLCVGEHNGDVVPHLGGQRRTLSPTEFDRVHLEDTQPSLDFPMMSSFKLIDAQLLRCCCDRGRKRRDD